MDFEEVRMKIIKVEKKVLPECEQRTIGFSSGTIKMQNCML